MSEFVRTTFTFDDGSVEVIIGPAGPPRPAYVHWLSVVYERQENVVPDSGVTFVYEDADPSSSSTTPQPPDNEEEPRFTYFPRNP
jgi:hypothetical protein